VAPATAVIASVEVVSATLPTDLPVAATVHAFDRAGNLVGDITSRSTLSISPDGACADGRCYGTSPGAHTVTAVYGSGPARVVGTGTWTLFPSPAAAVAVTSGDHQSAAPGTAFLLPVGVRVTDSDGDAVGGYLVQWRVVSGSASFPGGATHAQSLVGTASGTATAPRLVAGHSSGPVSVTASIGGRTVDVHLLVYTGRATVSVAAGNHQLVKTGKHFLARLKATVTDAAHRRLSGIAVTWRVTGGSARFTGGVTRAVSLTDTAGRAIAPVLTAGRITGPVTVTATTPGTGRSATYDLIVGRPPSVTSPTSVTFTVGNPNRFTITTTGFPRPVITLHGQIPAGLMLVDNHDGTATFAGTPRSNTEGSYPLFVDVRNGVADPEQRLMLTVASPESGTSAARGPLALTGFPLQRQVVLGVALLVVGSIIMVGARVGIPNGTR
jgi:hypothetical protein